MSQPAEQGERETHRVREPATAELNISGKRDPKSYKLTVKYALRKFGHVELRSLGNASEGVVQLAESLVRNKFAIIESIESGLTDLDDASNETGTRKGIKFVVKLKKSDEFDELTKNLPPPEK